MHLEQGISNRNFDLLAIDIENKIEIPVHQLPDSSRHRQNVWIGSIISAQKFLESLTSIISSDSL